MENKHENNSAVEFPVTREINYSLVLNENSKALKSERKLKLDRDSNRCTKPPYLQADVIHQCDGGV